MLKVISKLSFFNIFGQVVTYLLFSFLLNKNYAEEISAFVLLSTFLAICTPLCSLRFETAYLVSKDETCFSTFILFSLFTSFFIYLPLIHYLSFLFGFFEFLKQYNYFFIAYVIFQNIILLFLQANATKKGSFDILSYSYLVQPIFQLIFSLILSFLEIENFVVIAFLASQFFAILYIYIFDKCKLSFSLRLCVYVNLIKNYWKYPLISSPSALLNGYQQSLPILFISSFYDNKTVAVFYLLNKIIASPASVISNAAYNNIIYDLQNINKGNIIFYICKFLFFVFLFSFFSIITVNLLPENIVFLIMNTDLISIQTLSLFIFSIFMRSAASSVSGIIPISGNIAYEFYWKSSSLIITYITLYYYLINFDFNEFIFYFCIVDILLYLSYIILSLISAKNIK